MSYIAPFTPDPNAPRAHHKLPNREALPPATYGAVRWGVWVPMFHGPDALLLVAWADSYEEAARVAGPHRLFGSVTRGDWAPQARREAA
jgi:hypothetical protein